LLLFIEFPKSTELTKRTALMKPIALLTPGAFMKLIERLNPSALPKPRSRRKLNRNVSQNRLALSLSSLKRAIKTSFKDQQSSFQQKH
jgi:hypothetical protein